MNSELDFDDYFGAEMARLEPFRGGWIGASLTETKFSVTWLGRIFIRNIAMVFDAYLEKQKTG